MGFLVGLFPGIMKPLPLEAKQQMTGMPAGEKEMNFCATKGDILAN